MLVDVERYGNSKRLHQGVYQSYWRNFELDFRGRQVYELDYPRFDKIGAYGVCDSPEQLLELLPDDVKNGPRKFVISMVQLRKEDQEEGGWRWHKWGEYVGKQEPQCEYLLDEPVIEEVWTYHIYEVV